MKYKIMNGSLRNLNGWPILIILILKQKVDKHYYELMSDVEKGDAIVRWARASQCNIVIETGTFKGMTAMYLSNYLEKVKTIELDHKLAISAIEKFKNKKNVEVIEGNSGDKLRSIVAQLSERALFYLDAHYCGETTAKFEGNTPIWMKLQLY